MVVFKLSTHEEIMHIVMKLISKLSKILVNVSAKKIYYVVKSNKITVHIVQEKEINYYYYYFNVHPIDKVTVSGFLTI